MNLTRAVLAAAVASAVALFVSTSAYVDFVGLRVRAVKEPMVGRADGLIVPLSSTKLNRLGAPFAIVAHLRNESQAAVRITIRLDDREVCAPVVPPFRSVRVDCQFAGPWNIEADHQAALSGETPQWELEALELSTHHGSNAAFVRAYVLPAESRSYRTPSVFTCSLIALVLFGMLLVRSPPMATRLRAAHRTVVSIFILWTSGVIVAPFVSSYRIIVSANTVEVWLIVCFAPQIYSVTKKPVAAVVRWLLGLDRIPKALVAATLVVACFAVVTERRVAVEYGGNHSGLLVLSRARVEANPWLQEREDLKRSLIAPDNAGYDGQFMYAIAFDPFLLRFHDQCQAYQPFIDAPPYRYGRVGYPLIARTLALGQPDRFPGAMVATIYLGCFLAAFALGLIANQLGSSVWWGLAIALVPGFWASFRGALPEPVAAGALMAGYLCTRSQRLVLAALLFSIACLVRETSVFFVLCVGCWFVWSKQPRDAARLLVIALGPLSLWRLYVGIVFEPGWGFSAYWNPPDDFGFPFAGIVALWSDLWAGRYYPELWEMRRGIMGFSVIVLVGAALSWTMARVRPGPATAAAAIFAAMAVCFNLKNVWVGVGNAERLTSDLFFCLAVATPEFISRSKTWRTTLITFWCAVGAYLLFGTLDADFTRESFIRLVS